MRGLGAAATAASVFLGASPAAALATTARAFGDGPPSPLPEIDSVLTLASDKVRDFASQARQMQARVTKVQETNRAALAIKKAEFEKQLAVQADVNNLMSKRNEKLREHVAGSEQRCQELKRRADGLASDNKLLRNVLKAVEMKISAADAFLNESMRLTDDTNSEAMQVLSPKQEPSLAHFLEIATARPSNQRAFLKPVEDHVGITSLLQVSAWARLPSSGSGPSAEEFVSALSRSLEEMATAERDAEAQLKGHFMAMMDSSARRSQALLKEQQSLNMTIQNLRDKEEALHIAQEHLLDTREKLQERLQGVLVFATTVNEISKDALNPIAKVLEKRQTASPTQATATVLDSEQKTTAGQVNASLLAEGSAPGRPDQAPTVEEGSGILGFMWR